MKYIFLDPGESTGWCTWWPDIDAAPRSGTLIKNTHTQIWSWLEENAIGCGEITIVYEGFHLFGTHKNAMVGNSFYTCEIIGVIKLFAGQRSCSIIEQMPGDKKYAGKRVGYISDGFEHSKDAWDHMQFYRRRHGLWK